MSSHCYSSPDGDATRSKIPYGVRERLRRTLRTLQEGFAYAMTQKKSSVNQKPGNSIKVNSLGIA